MRVDPPMPGMWATTKVYHVQNGVHFISPSPDTNMKSRMVLVEAGLIVIPWASHSDQPIRSQSYFFTGPESDVSYT